MECFSMFFDGISSPGTCVIGPVVKTCPVQSLSDLNLPWDPRDPKCFASVFLPCRRVLGGLDVSLASELPRDPGGPKH